MVNHRSFDPLDILSRYYPVENELKHIILTHSKQVSDYAVAVARAHPELKADVAFVADAAMLHDIGCFLCDAPGIQCFGKEPYIRHGHLGAELLRTLGLDRYADVCERHTGAGLSLEQIVENQLPIPHKHLIPQNIEEEIICYADKFYSKSRLQTAKTPEAICKSLTHFGQEGVERWMAWHERFAL